ncbi:MAG: winged helix-turn-helix transcriptional regulator [Synergistales bacterium]|nr:winged helix-turn-helix transcriptional regulator [Synergistales bacterium]
MEESASFFKLLGDPTRLQILLILLFNGETCVCQFSKCLNAPQPLVSRHLRILRNSGILQTEQKKQWVYYRLNNKLEGYQKEILEIIRKRYSHAPEIRFFQETISSNTC